MHTCALSVVVQGYTCTPLSWDRGSPLCTVYIFIFGWRYGSSSSACAPAAPHSLLGLGLLQNPSQRPISTPRHECPCVSPVCAQAGHRQLMVAHGKAVMLQGSSWQCHTRLCLMCFSYTSVSQVKNIQGVFYTSFEADPFYD